jgi:hypothetical protein
MILAAVCLLFAVAAVVAFLVVINDSQVIVKRGNTSIYYVEEVPKGIIRLNLIWLNRTIEEEREYFNSLKNIFQGTVREINNIAIKNGESKHISHWGLIRVEITEVLQGEIAEGDIISMLSSLPISENVDIRPSRGIKRLEVGMEGIFMPQEFGDTAYFGHGENKIFYSEIADYFISGFYFNKSGRMINELRGEAYPSINNGSSIEDIKALIASYN